MRNWIKFTLITTVSTALCLPLVHAQTGTYYRYKDKEGQTVMSSALPPEAAGVGYEIITSNGTVLETIAPQKTPAEIQHDSQAESTQREQEKQTTLLLKNQAQLSHKEDILLKSFSTEKDIIRSRDEKIASIKTLEEIVVENLTRLEKQQTEAMQTVAHLQAMGQPVPVKISKDLMDIQRQIDENQAFLTRKKAEIERINVKYQGLIERFHTLQHPSSLSNSPPPANGNSKERGVQ